MMSGFCSARRKRRRVAKARCGDVVRWLGVYCAGGNIHENEIQTLAGQMFERNRDCATSAAFGKLGMSESATAHGL